MLFKRKNNINSGNIIAWICISLLLGASIFQFTVSSNDEPEYASNNIEISNDMLAYISNEHDLLLHNPVDRTTTRLLSNVNNFVMSPDGQVAYTRIDEDDTDIYVYDPSLAGIEPINISQNLMSNNRPLAWSPNGEYLAFASYSYLVGDEPSLYVWDGETIMNIMPDDGLDTADRFYVDWSYDGRLAFTIRHGWSDIDIPSEIYLWDGNTTTALSQNPKGQDGGVQWSRNGQLMFWSSWKNESDIYIWDGVSFRGGLPDVDSFIRLAPELEPYYSIWTNENNVIGFTVSPQTSPSGRKEIILWDWENEQIIQQLPVTSDNAWNWLAEGGQVVISSQLASGIPSVYLDVENTEGEILFSEHVGEYAWSSDGYLAYCGITDEGMSLILTIWDGEQSWVVDKVSYRSAHWLYGERSFSCNNG